jgi:hypothetical protein
LGGIDNEISVGALTRDDISHVGRLPSEGRIPLSGAGDPAFFSNNDQIYLFAAGAYVQVTTYWTSSFRSVRV